VKNVKLAIKRIAKIALLYAAVFSVLYLMAVSITVLNVPTLGGGEGTVSAPNVTDFVWQMTGTPANVTGVSLKFDARVPLGTEIYVYLLDTSSDIIASGTSTLPANLPIGTATTITTLPSIDASVVYNVKVTVVGP
jgi:hypothetical protein